MEITAQEIPPKPTTDPGPGMEWILDRKAIPPAWVAATKLIGSINARLASATIMEQFREDLFPDRPKTIEAGTAVYVKPLKVAGRVARITSEGECRVEVKGSVQTFWPLELEPLPTEAVR